jgi:hypothetical protein
VFGKLFISAKKNQDQSLQLALPQLADGLPQRKITKYLVCPSSHNKLGPFKMDGYVSEEWKNSKQRS